MEWLNINILTGRLLSTLGILIIAFLARAVLFRLVKVAVKQIEDGKLKTAALEARAQTLSSIIKNIINGGVLVLAGLMILSEWGINIGPVLASVGILGLALGFGSQALVKDVVTGFFILLENQFNVGDWVEIAGLKGRIQEVKLRTTILQEEKGTIHIIPNSKISVITKYKK